MLCWNFRHQLQMPWCNITEERRPQWKHSSLDEPLLVRGRGGNSFSAGMYLHGLHGLPYLLQIWSIPVTSLLSVQRIQIHITNLNVVSLSSAHSPQVFTVLEIWTRHIAVAGCDFSKMGNNNLITLWWTRQHHNRCVKNNIQPENLNCSPQAKMCLCLTYGCFFCQYYCNMEIRLNLREWNSLV